jgi:hypothetical protein
VPLQVLNNNGYDNALASHQLANELRELYDLSPITTTTEEKISYDIITNLNGLLKEYAATDLEENPIDDIKNCCCRENLS